MSGHAFLSCDALMFCLTWSDVAARISSICAEHKHDEDKMTDAGPGMVSTDFTVDATGVAARKILLPAYTARHSHGPSGAPPLYPLHSELLGLQQSPSADAAAGTTFRGKGLSYKMLLRKADADHLYETNHWALSCRIRECWLLGSCDLPTKSTNSNSGAVLYCRTIAQA